MFRPSEEDNALLTLPGIAVITIAIRVVDCIRDFRLGKADEYAPLLISEDESTRSVDGENRNSLKTVLKSDGFVVSLLRLTRLFCVLGLLSLSVRELIVENSNFVIKVALLVFYIYVEVLSSISIASTSSYWRNATSKDATFCLFVAFLAYFIRDVWPYAILYPKETHPREWITWTRMTLLTLSGFVIPLTMPQTQKSGLAEVDAGTAHSLLARLSFSYMDKIVFFASRSPNLTVADLPPLPFSHRAALLAKRALPKLDPLSVGERYMLWGQLRVFRLEYGYMSFWTFLYAASRLLGPYGMQNLLAFLEMSDSTVPDFSFRTIYIRSAQNFVLQPWIWIAVIALAPVLGSIFQNQYLYYSSVVSVEGESVLSQLIFEHALRIRMTSDANDSDTIKADSTTGFPADASALEEAGRETLHAQDASVVSSETSLDGRTAGVSTDEQAKTQASGSDSSEDESKKPSPTSHAPNGETKSEAEKTIPIVGKINNLLTTDTSQVTTAQEILALPSAVIQATIAIVFMYSMMGWSALVGFAVLVVGMPLPTMLSKMLMDAQHKKMNKTDQRVQSVTDSVQIIRTLKLLGWEAPAFAQLSLKREAELKWVLYGKLLDVAMGNVQLLLPLSCLIAVFGTYALVMKQPFTAARAFPALATFEVLHEQIEFIMDHVPNALRAKVSFDRFNEFLNDTEMLVQSPLVQLPSGTEASDIASNLMATTSSIEENDRIGFYNAAFSWNRSAERSSGSGSLQSSTSIDRFRLHLNGEIMFKKGKINLIVGSTASGKTSLLMALLGEMHYIPDGPTSWYNLPRKGGVAYAPQESWVLNATVKENIVFNQSFDEARYRKVLEQCSFERDLGLWEAGDMTEVGEKGLTLSGGQKARVTLARALYSSASIVLLDDPLAALDVHTAKHVVNNALRGELVHNRTIILVTHNRPLAAPLADHVIALGRDGCVVGQGSINEVLQMDDELRALANKEEAEIETEENVTKNLDKRVDIKDSKAPGKLILSEEKAMGRVEWRAVMLFISGVGGPFTWTILVTSAFLCILNNIFKIWWMGYWASQYDNRPASEVSAAWYLTVYVMLFIGGMLVGCVDRVFMSFRTTRASRLIYQKLLKSILSAPLRWLDVVPVGRIITRCTQDINAVDTSIPDLTNGFMNLTLILVQLFLSAVIMTGWPALISGVATAVMGGWLGHVYLKAQLSVKREWSNAKSPVISQVGTAVSGIIVIRAYHAQAYFRRELFKRLDVYSRTGRTYYDLERWIAFRIELLGSVFSGVVVSYLVYGTQTGPSRVGFTMSMVIIFSRLILTWVRVFNHLEVQCNSLERILDFLRIDQEPQSVESGKPPAYWPASGSLKLENLSASYSDDGPMVLHDINLEIKSGQRIGIVGRTGAGKSSIMLALLRAINTTGKVYYDNLATDTINLDALRSNITLIPQQPELLQGTLRENLDPFGDHDDASLNEALRSAGVYDINERQSPASHHSDEATSTYGGHTVVGLDTSIESGGKNLSLGQRQIIALARAILRRSKILILDEATAAIDYKTDAAIQKSLRTELSKDTTIITIAHRLQTIMDSDKILVLDAGRVAEFDSPVNLLKTQEGFFRGLVDASDDRNQLLVMAGVQPEEL